MTYLSHPENSAAALARDLGCHRSVVTKIAKGKREFTRQQALILFRKRGLKFGPLANASDDEIQVLERFEGAA